jgi:hypothetical protein
VREYVAHKRMAFDTSPEFHLKPWWEREPDASARLRLTQLPQYVITHHEFRSADAGNPSATKQFTVKVLSAAEQLDALRTAVTGVGTGSSLADKVKQIQKALADGRTKSACTGLDELLTMVANQAKGNKLTRAQAASFTAQANRLRAVLSC